MEWWCKCSKLKGIRRAAVSQCRPAFFQTLTWEKCLAQSASRKTRESYLLITALINSDGYKAADAEEKAHATAGWQGDFPPSSSWGKDNTSRWSTVIRYFRGFNLPISLVYLLTPDSLLLPPPQISPDFKFRRWHFCTSIWLFSKYRRWFFSIEFYSKIHKNWEV